MLSSVEKLQKFFRLEVERGYDNRAVVGGLDKILPAWESEARANHLGDEIIQTVITGLKTYPTLDPAGRAEMLNRLMSELSSAAQAQSSGARVFGELPVRNEPAAQNEPAARNEPTAQNEPEGGPGSEEAMEGEQARSEPAVRSEPAQRASRPDFNRKNQPRPEREGGRGPSGSRVYAQADTTGLNAPLRVLQGVGPKMAQNLATLGLNTLEDLLYYFPRRYDDYSQLKPINRLEYGEETTVLGTIQNIITRPIRGGKLQMTEAVVTDGTGFLRLTWFNQPWLASRYTPGTQVVLSGKIDQYLGRLVMSNPEIEPIEQEHLHTNRIVPVYPLTARLTQKNLRRIMYQTVTYWAQRVPDYLPDRVRSATKVIDLGRALTNVHFPESQDMLDVARWRLAFDEIFLLQLGVLRQKRTWQALTTEPVETPREWLEEQISHLPFQLTGAQQRVLEEIRSELGSGHPMDRLIQGDVGSGKTVVAALAIAMVTRQGGQAAIMAPTGILAEQHYRSMLKLLAGKETKEPPLREQPASQREAGARGAGQAVAGLKSIAMVQEIEEWEDLQSDDTLIEEEQESFTAWSSEEESEAEELPQADELPQTEELPQVGDQHLTNEQPAAKEQTEAEEQPGTGGQPLDEAALSPLAEEESEDLPVTEETPPTEFLSASEIRKQAEAQQAAGLEAQQAGPDVQQPDLPQEPEPETPTYALLRPEEIRLLTGDTPEAERQEIRAGLENGTIKLLIGTHALYEAPVQFKDLHLAVIDEQHRFGVAQRAALRAKGANPHLLVMTATPIPRSLALTVYGDLDLSVMDEMPPGRQPVSTHVLRPVERERAYNLVRSQVEKGHQAFIIYPMVEQGEPEEGQETPPPGLPQLSAVEEQQRLQKDIFPKLKVGLLHGRMKPDEKDRVMKAFRDREFDILVSTTVVEVGVDIPNATVMLIEGANRFGLAQLHQLRGRVGRGADQAYCLLIPDKEDAVENERLSVMSETNDGFVLAERDLQQRGPGEFLGTRQAGFATLKMANLTDVRLIEKARQQAQSIFKDDPELTSPEYQPLVRKLQQFWGDGRGDIS